MRISDWSSDVCSSDLPHIVLTQHAGAERDEFLALMLIGVHGDRDVDLVGTISVTPDEEVIGARIIGRPRRIGGKRSEEHTSELQSLMRISYAVFCLQKKRE